MAQQTKKERILRAHSEAVTSRFSKDAQNAMNDMLWILAEGTRYETEVREAFEHLEMLDGLNKDGTD